MNWYLFIAAFSMFVGGILSIASSSIGTQCYNENPQIKEEKPDNFNFLVSNLVSAILLVILGCLSMYFAFKASSRVVTINRPPPQYMPMPQVQASRVPQNYMR